MKNKMIITALTCLLSPSIGLCTMHSHSQDLSNFHAETCPVCKAKKEIFENQESKKPTYRLPYRCHSSYLKSPAFLEHLATLALIGTLYVGTLVPIIYYFNYRSARTVLPPAPIIDPYLGLRRAFG